MSIAPTTKRSLSSNQPPLRDAQPARVLVVDDEDFMLSLVGRMLRALGFDVVLAKSGFEAMACLSRSSCQMVITDLQMPKMNGHTLAGWIKHHFKGTPVIVMTGNTPASVADYAKTGIVDQWIFKPFGLDELKTMLSGFA